MSLELEDFVKNTKKKKKKKTDGIIKKNKESQLLKIIIGRTFI